MGITKITKWPFRNYNDIDNDRLKQSNVWSILYVNRMKYKIGFFIQTDVRFVRFGTDV